MLKTSLTMLAAVLLAGCASIKPIAYTAQPERIGNPGEEVKNLILANTVQGCVTTPEMKETMLVVKALCSNGVGNQVIRFDRVKSVALEQSGEWYRVMVKHGEGIADFWWSSKSLEDMQRMADAITALAKLPAAAPAKDTSSI
jgi:hypothetical protein